MRLGRFPSPEILAELSRHQRHIAATHGKVVSLVIVPATTEVATPEVIEEMKAESVRDQ
jgi:hypothetical protein